LAERAQRVLTIRPDQWVFHEDPNVDLAAASLARIAEAAGGVTDLFCSPIGRYTIRVDNEAERYPAAMQIAMAGYPNGLWDEHNNLPLLRRGVTASHPGVDFDGRPEIAVDIASYPGSSGSPIWFHDRQYFGSAVRFLGVLYAGPTIDEDGRQLIQPIASELGPDFQRHSPMLHLGYAIKARRVLEIANQLGRAVA